MSARADLCGGRSAMIVPTATSKTIASYREVSLSDALMAMTNFFPRGLAFRKRLSELAKRVDHPECAIPTCRRTHNEAADVFEAYSGVSGFADDGARVDWA
jgi:hypothetical protein